jgi:hypothetical protein
VKKLILVVLSSVALAPLLFLSGCDSDPARGISVGTQVIYELKEGGDPAELPEEVIEVMQGLGHEDFKNRELVKVYGKDSPRWLADKTRDTVTFRINKGAERTYANDAIVRIEKAKDQHPMPKKLGEEVEGREDRGLPAQN